MRPGICVYPSPSTYAPSKAAPSYLEADSSNESTSTIPASETFCVYLILNLRLDAVGTLSAVSAL